MITVYGSLKALLLVCLCSIVSVSFAQGQSELDALKRLPAGYMVFGKGYYGSNMQGIYKANLGDTAIVQLDAMGNNPSINIHNPSLIAYSKAVSTGSDQHNVWLMDYTGANKRMITTTPIKQITALHWTDRDKIVIAGGDFLTVPYASAKAYLLDTTGSISEINIGFTFATTGSGLDGIHVWGDRIMFRVMKTTTKDVGNFLGIFNQDQPTVAPVKVYEDGLCGPAIASNGSQPTVALANHGGHDGCLVLNARTGALTKDITWLGTYPSYNFHFIVFAKNSTNWGYCASREGGLWPYIIDFEHAKLIRHAFKTTHSGATYGDLWLGNVTQTQATAPIFMPNKTAFSVSLDITLSNITPGSQIYYTTNGSDPTTSSMLFSGPITLTATTTIKARAYKTGLTESPISSKTFFKTPSTALSKIRFYPRTGFGYRVAEGVFEGTNGDPNNGPYTVLSTIYSIPQDNQWVEITTFDTLDPGFRYIRYRSPEGSYGNIAEVEFYRGGTKVSGTPFGTPGSYNNNGNDFSKVFDGNLNTYHDYLYQSGAFAGLDLGVTSIVSPSSKPIQSIPAASMQSAEVYTFQGKHIGSFSYTDGASLPQLLKGSFHTGMYAVVIKTGEKIVRKMSFHIQ